MYFVVNLEVGRKVRKFLLEYRIVNIVIFVDNKYNFTSILLDIASVVLSNGLNTPDIYAVCRVVFK